MWRQPFIELMGPAVYDEVCSAVERGLNATYSSQAPWSVIKSEYIPDQGGQEERFKPRDWLQITREVGKRQPCHWDTSVPWFENDRGHWAPLSIVLHINDGLSTFLPGEPSDTFSLMRKLAESKKTLGHCTILAQNLVRLLDNYDRMDKGVQLTSRQRSRAGQCLAFHAGHQAHAGMGWYAEPDPCTPTWCGRVVSYMFAMPKSEVRKLWTNPICNPEYPWGLMREGITPQMVLFIYVSFLFVLCFCVLAKFWPKISTKKIA